MRLAVIAASLVLVLVATQLDPQEGSAQGVIASGSAASASTLPADAEPTRPAPAPTPVATPTPAPVPDRDAPQAAPDLAAEPPLAGTTLAGTTLAGTTLAGTTLAAGAGGVTVVESTDVTVNDPTVTQAGAETDVVSEGEGEGEGDDIVCVLPEVLATEAREAETTADQPIDAEDLWFGDSLELASADWQPLSGLWTFEDGTYQQTDDTGYDFITELNRRPPSQFRVEVDILAPVLLNAGFMLGQPEAGSRAGATLVDFTEDGTFLRWGVYEPGTGQYRYVGGAALADGFDPLAPVRLGIERRSDRTYLSVDGREIAAIDPIPDGRIGLVTSVSAAAFSDFTIEELGA